MKTRCCKQCGQEKPETADFFTRHKKSRGGLLAVCKLCKRAAETARRGTNLELFRLHSRESHARHHEERNAAKRVAYAANPGPAKHRAAAYSKADPERKREINAAYRAVPENRERARLRSLKFAADHRGLVRERARQWLRNHPDERRAQGHVKRARKHNAVGRHTAEDVLRLYYEQNGRCYYCDVDLNGTYHVDHKMPLVRGGSNDVANICCACPACNLAKHDMTEAEFRRNKMHVVHSL